MIGGRRGRTRFAVQEEKHEREKTQALAGVRARAQIPGVWGVTREPLAKTHNASEHLSIVSHLDT